MGRPKQERAVHTRELLVDAAAGVFDENGFAGASINKILSRAGVTAGAMYFHFRSKADLARAVIHEQSSRLAIPEKPGGIQQLIDLTMYLTGQFTCNVRFRAGVRLAVEQGESGLHDYTAYRWWIKTFERELVAARERDELLPGVQESSFARFVVASYTGTQVMSDIATARADLPEQVVAMWRYLLPSVVPPVSLTSYVIDPARKDLITV
ncbi:ScbR family autoregulator-binding transcription factor [Streptomyces boncukensis]|uniref:TetR/AcrR family transcriptional regulator n=1 Tax=Streptomyces boncukensis TaxID=2711219 RepID=A0A6G4WTI2_9ACTN|nr:ScbR family autoregulator-binding transcription factor [Streptomyces boncukensis]NGO67950.1 TetR/AcrR family transcriptional regulator [Streptomyces boncukensis]